MDYVETAKMLLKNTEGTHSVEHNQAYATLSIAYSLASIADSLRKLAKEGK